jgi:two-component system sensor histidine kinase YesM
VIILNISLRNKLIIFFAILVLIPIIAGNVITLSSYTVAARQNLETFNRNNLRSAGIIVDNAMNSLYHLSLYLAFEDNLVNFLKADPGSPQYNTIIKRANSVLTLLSPTAQHLSAVNILTMDGRSLYRGGLKDMPITKAQRDQADTLSGYFFWTAEVNSNDEDNLSMVRLLRGPNDFSNHIGYVKLSLSISRLSEMLVSPKDYPDIRYFLQDDTGRTILAKNGDTPLSDEILLDALRSGESISTGSSAVNIHGKGTFYISSYDLSGGWRLLSVVPEISYFKLFPGIWKMILMETALCFSFCMMLALLFTTYTIKPLKHLGELMQDVAKGDFSVQFESPAEMEIRVLAGHFNDMSRQLSILYNEVYASRVKLIEAHLNEMEARINPHFLYNALDTIYWMAKMGRMEDVSDMTSSLSKLFRMTLNVDPSGRITLKQELEHLDCYLSIQRHRYVDNIQFISRVDESLIDQSVCRFSLQPLVENAVMHGVGPIGIGTIEVDVYKEGKFIIFRISDSGGRLDPSEVDGYLTQPESALVGTKGFALRNLNDRVKMYFGDSFGLTYRIEDGRSVFILCQPYLEVEHA